MYILINAATMAIELAAIAAVAWLGLHYPLVFAGVTAAIAITIGVRLEFARLQNEFPFYFDRVPGRAVLFAWVVGGAEAFVKALLAGVVGLLTFLGTDPERLTWVALIFAFTLFLGVQIVRWLTHTLKARPLRWGYFRLAAPLGLIYSIGIVVPPRARLQRACQARDVRHAGETVDGAGERVPVSP